MHVLAGIQCIALLSTFLVFMGNHLCVGGDSALGSPCTWKVVNPPSGTDKTQGVLATYQISKYSCPIALPRPSHLHASFTRGKRTHPFSVSTVPSFQACHRNRVTHNATLLKLLFPPQLDIIPWRVLPGVGRTIRLSFARTPVKTLAENGLHTEDLCLIDKAGHAS